jgi:hypothetical protein
VIGSVMQAVVAANIQGLGADVLGGLQGAVDGIGDAIGGPLKDAVGEGIEGAAGAPKEVGKGLGDLGNALGEEAGKALEGAGDAVKKGVEGALDGVFRGREVTVFGHDVPKCYVLPAGPTHRTLWSGCDDGPESRSAPLASVGAVHRPRQAARASSSSPTICVIGYASDQGVRANQGRAGAAYEGPSRLRARMAGFPEVEGVSILDGGEHRARFVRALRDAALARVGGRSASCARAPCP